MNNDMLPTQPNQAPVSSQPNQTAFAPPTKQKKAMMAVLIAAILVAVVVAGIYLVNLMGLFTGTDQNATVTISANGFTPQTIKIKKGQTIEWINDDSNSHQIASDPFPDHSTLPDLFVESPLGKGESFSYTFEKTGTFTYHDQLKPAAFKGTVIVE